MTIHPFFAQDTTTTDVRLQGGATGFDSVWATEVPTATPSQFESVMLSEDKLYVVLAVVLIIWFGILLVLFRTDRKLAALEQRLENVASDLDD